MLIEWFKLQFSTPLGATAQLFGILPLILSFFTFLHRDRKRTVMTKATVDFLFAIHFFLLGEAVGGCLNIVNTVRDIVFSQKGKRRWASRNYIPVLFCTVTVVVAILRFEEWYSLLPMIGSVLAVVGFWCSSVENIRKFNVPATLLWLVYSIKVGSVANIVSNLIAIGSLAVGYVKSRRARLLSSADTKSGVSAEGLNSQQFSAEESENA